MPRVVRERPDGARACWQEDETPGKGGRWVECEELQAEGGLAGRFNQFFEQCDPEARELVREDVEAVIEELFELAQYGELYLRRGRDEGDVVVMRIRREIYELVVSKQQISGVYYHLRVYFTEPIDEDGALLALSVEWKRDDWDVGRGEQDQHAKDAFDRFKNHCRRQ